MNFLSNDSNKHDVKYACNTQIITIKRQHKMN